MDDGHTHFGTNLSDDLPNPQAHLAMQHLKPIFRCPDEMVAMIKSRVTTAAVVHSLAESVAEASIRLKSEGFLLQGDSTPTHR